MSSMPCTQVIKLADHSRFILQRLDQNLLLFIHSCTTKDNDFDIEYWKPWKVVHFSSRTLLQMFYFTYFGIFLIVYFSFL